MTTSQSGSMRATITQEMRDSINQILANQRNLEASQQALAISVASLPSRQEIAVEFDKRVSSVAYQSDREALVERIKKLEDAGKQTWAKAAVIVSIVSVVVTVLLATHVI